MKNAPQYIEMEDELHKLATLQWQIFMTIIGPDAVVTAKVHLMRSKGRSIKQIATRLKITKSQVETRLKRSPKIIFPHIPTS